MPATVHTLPPAVSYSRSPIWVRIQTGQDLATAVNLKAYIEVWTYDDDNEPVKLLQAMSHYSDTGVATFDISGAFENAIALPPDISINTASVLFAFLEIPQAQRKYFVKYADRYGFPAVLEELQNTDDFHVILNASGDDADPSPQVVGGAIPMVSLEQYEKVVTDDQPDYIYLRSILEINVARTVRLFMRDGSVEILPATSQQLMPDTVYWTATGFQQLNITSSGAVMGYSVTITNEDTGVTIYSRRYILDCHRPWKHYLMVENGWGGYECHAFLGKSAITLEAGRTQMRRTRWGEFDTETGDYVETLRGGYKTIDLQTGHRSLEEVQVIADVLYGRCWLVNMEKQRFEQFVILESDTGSLEEDAQLYSLSIQGKIGRHNTYRHR